MAILHSIFALLLVGLASAAVEFSFVRDVVAPKIRTITDNPAKMATVVRFLFHECAGGPGCNGCINIALGNNRGLEGVQGELDDLYDNAREINSVLSRADFYALAGLIAANTAASRAEGMVIPDKLKLESFRTGRRDCAGPSTTDVDLNSDLPGANMNIDQTLAYFRNRFGFSDRETVAISGAHNLGRARIFFSGQWVTDNDRLSGSYYKNLVNSNGAAGNLNWLFDRNAGQWSARDNRATNLLMLNTDMVLSKAIGPNRRDRPVCDFNTCPVSARTGSIVQEYADNPQTFLNDFAAVFMKMIETCARDASGNPIRDPARGACTLEPLITATGGGGRDVSPPPSPKPPSPRPPPPLPCKINRRTGKCRKNRG